MDCFTELAAEMNDERGSEVLGGMLFHLNLCEYHRQLMQEKERGGQGAELARYEMKYLRITSIYI